MLLALTEELKNHITWRRVLVGLTGVGLILLKRRMGGAKCPSKASMAGKIVIVTGANSGIGKATTTELVKRKAKVIMACRDMKLAEEAATDIRKTTKDGILVIKKLDLSSLQSVRDFCSDIIKTESRIDVLINNAGVYQCPMMHTEDGFEMQMGVNHLGHFLLTNLMLDHLRESSPSRIVIVSSGLHKLGAIDFSNLNSERAYKKGAAYNNSKLANNLFAQELARRMEGSGVCVYCVRPGMVRTNLGRYVPFSNSKFLKMILAPLAWLLVKSPYEGCQTVLYCAVAEELEGVSGHYYSNCSEEPWSTVSLNNNVAKELWAVSGRLTRL